jgi:nitroimidazol reductase NimA-like FMN-containing flavoprotein (pyridoxamine 5'-phosphate oxidase superfamily)
LCITCYTLQNKEETEYGWNDLVASGYVEYVDTEEEETTMIAMNIKDLAAARQNPQVGEGQHSLQLMFLLFIFLVYLGRSNLHLSS